MIIKFKYIGIPLGNLKSMEYQIEIEDNTDVFKLLKIISEEYNISLDYLKNCSLMINNKKADLTTKLLDNDRILIMKVLGGG